MKGISYKRHRFRPDVIRCAGWLYLRFPLSLRAVEDALSERGLDLSYETVRRWAMNFGPFFARELRKSRPAPTTRWPLDEMIVRIGGRRMHPWRAVDDEGEVLGLLVQSRGNEGAALRLMRKLLREQGFAPTVIVTDKLRSYGAAFRKLRLTARHEQGTRKNNRAECSHQPARDESAACNASNRRVQPSASSAPLLPSTTCSTSSATSSPGRRCGSSGPRP